MKKSIIAITLVVIAASLAYCSTSRLNNQSSTANSPSDLNAPYSSTTIDLSKINWLQRYPQLKSIPANSQTAMIDKLRTSESISALIGSIDNPYGVRNDILDAIMKIVPESNTKMLQAAIKMEFYSNMSSFAPTSEEKLSYQRKSALAAHCAARTDRLNNLKNYNQIMDTTDKLDRNTAARANYINNLDQTVFAWQLIGTGLAADEENQHCDTGEY